MKQPATTSRAVIDLDALRRNARLLAATAATPWMAVVKADAYGHGIGPVALTCLEAGASWLGVAQLAEALHLRGLLDRAGTARPEPGPDAVPTGRAPRLLTWLAPVLEPQEAAAAAAHVEAGGRPARLHLKADTGLSRAGAVADDLPALAAAARAAEQDGALDVVGLWSHLARADEPACGATEAQLAAFRLAEAVVAEAGLIPRVRHVAATGGLLWHPEARLDLVRAGIGLYGLSPDPAVATAAELGLTPVMRLEAPLTMTKRVAAGTAVSYGGTWCAPTDRWLGLVPLGYADGVPRHAASVGPVAVGGLRTTVVGRVCMDQFVIDLGPAVDEDGHDLPCPARAGDTAVLWGPPQADGTVPTADDWAAACGTINYEIVTRLGPHVPRVPVSQEARS